MKIKTASLLALSLLACSGTSQAALASSYMATSCQPYTELDVSNLTFSSTELSNNSNETAYVSCPIVRQNIYNTNGTKSAWMVVHSYAGGEIGCQFQSRTDRAIQVGFRRANTSSTSKVNLDLDVNSSSAYGTYSIFCSLPPGSILHSYGIEEFSGTDTVVLQENLPTKPGTIKLIP